MNGNLEKKRSLLFVLSVKVLIGIGRGKMQNEIKYFSMFTGVGGFELGISRSCGDVEHYRQKENSQNSNGNKSISKKEQTSNSKNNFSDDESSENSSGTLFQNGQKQSNSSPQRLEETKGNTQFGQSLRQTSNGVLREGNGIRDDEKSLQQREDSPDTCKFRCIGCSENNKYASELLAKRFPDVINYGDCTKINPDELPDFDLLCGGFPCQSFSIAGKRKGFEDTRGTMFFEVARILKVKRPKIVLLENVKGLLNHNKGQTFQIILETLDELGYETQWMVLNSKFFGVPQNRERVFIIGSLRGKPRPEILPFGENDSIIIKTQQEFSREISAEETSNCLTSRYFKMAPTDTYISYARKDKSQHSRVYNTDGIAPTLAGASKLSGDCTPKLIVENKKIRKLTPIECERIQSFPDNWTEGFSNTQRYKMMGNAVTVNVVQAIMSKFPFCKA